MQVHIANVRTRRAGEPRIVDHDIERTKPVDREVNCSGNIFLGCYVAVEIVNIGVASKGIKNLLPKIVLDINEAHFSTMFVEYTHDALSDA